MQTIKIRRPKETFNENIKYKIIVDGVVVGRMKNGEEKILTISDNAKTLFAENHSGKSNKIEIDSISNDKIIQVSGNEFMNKYLPYYGPILSFSALIFFLDHDYDNIRVFGKALFALGIFVAIYVLIFRRNNWLKLIIVNETTHALKNISKHQITDI